jgi:hypothetical protein
MSTPSFGSRVTGFGFQPKTQLPDAEKESDASRREASHRSVQFLVREDGRLK